MERIINPMFQAIRQNWGIRHAADALPQNLRPGRQNSPSQWGVPIVDGLQQLSMITKNQFQDAREKLRKAVTARRRRNKTKEGKVNEVTVTDINAVIRQVKSSKTARPASPRTTPRTGYGRRQLRAAPAIEHVDHASEQPSAQEDTEGGNHASMAEHERGIELSNPFIARARNHHPTLARATKRTRDQVGHDDGNPRSTKRRGLDSLPASTPDVRFVDDPGYLGADPLANHAVTRLREQAMAGRLAPREKVARWRNGAQRAIHGADDNLRPTAEASRRITRGTAWLSGPILGHSSRITRPRQPLRRSSAELQAIAQAAQSAIRTGLARENSDSVASVPRTGSRNPSRQDVSPNTDESYLGDAESDVVGDSVVLSHRTVELALQRRHPIPDGATLDEKTQLYEMLREVAEAKIAYSKAAEAGYRYIILGLQIQRREAEAR